MTGQEIVDQVKSDLDQSGSTGTFTDAQILEIINDGYVDFCRETEPLEKSTTTTVAALEQYLTIPTDHLETTQIRWSYQTHLYPQSERTMDYNQRDWVWEVGTPEYCVYWNWDRLRLKPIPSAAGTVTWRFAYIPGDITLVTEPGMQSMWHGALVSYANAICFLTMKEKDNFIVNWNDYTERRKKAKAQFRDGQRTPDHMLSQRPVTVYNYPLWDIRFRR